MREVRTTACNRDCPDTCAIDVELEDGVAVALRGRKDDPIAQGFLCERTSRFLDRQRAPDRLTQPLIRRDGQLQPASWDAALDLIAERMLQFRDESTAASILHYRSGGSLGILKFYTEYLFQEFGPVTLKSGDICSGASEAAQERDFGVSESHHIDDLLNSKVIVLWGKNPFISGPHLLPLLKKAKANGAILVGIDPVRTRVAQLCDQFYCPAPGTDFWLAMAIARHLMDTGQDDPQVAGYSDHYDEFCALVKSHGVQEWVARTQLSVESAVALADLYAANGPTATLVGWGMGRRKNGSQTVRAIDALVAVSGNLGIAGGGASYYFGRRSAFDFDFLAKAPARTLSEACLGREILEAKDPPVRMIWVTAGNPVAMLPDSKTVAKAFAQCEFKVSVETHPTDTTDLADVVLPTRTLIEDDDLLGAYGNHYLRVSQPVVEAPPKVWHEVRIIRELAERVGLSGLVPADIRDCKKRFLTHLEPHGVTLESLEAGPVLNPLAKKILFADHKFPTATGKMQLLTELAHEPPSTTSDYPFTLLAISDAGAQSSQWTNRLQDHSFVVRVHSSALAGAEAGSRVRVESELGSVAATLEFDDRLRTDIVLMPKGGMLRDGRCANLLVRAQETDSGGGAVYYDTAVRIVRIGNVASSGAEVRTGAGIVH